MLAAQKRKVSLKGALKDIDSVCNLPEIKEASE